MKYLCFFILFVSVAAFFYSCTQHQERNEHRTVELEIIGDKTYDELYVRAWQLGTNVRIDGETTNGYQWTFTIPDSIVERTISFDIRSPDSTPPIITPLTKYYRPICFLNINQGDTLKSNMFHFKKDERRIRLKVEYLYTVPEFYEQYIPALDSVFVMEGWYIDYFHIDPKQNRYMQESMLTPLGFFFDAFGTERYAGFLTEFASKIKENPTSLYYMSNLASTAGYYESREDIERLYNLFSDEMQHSYLGQSVQRHFSTFKVENVSLLNTETNTEEKIVLDSAKYTLLIFSASYCAPCIKKIPMLKEIHNRAGTLLNMVYVTIDDEERLPQWEALMHRENIMWRRLWLGNNTHLRSTWSLIGVPDYMLVHPTFDAQKITLNDENDVAILYSIIQ